MPRNEGAAAQGSAGKATFADRSPWVGRRRDSLAVLRVVHPFPSFLVALVAVALVPLTDSEAPLDRRCSSGHFQGGMRSTGVAPRGRKRTSAARI